MARCNSKSYSSSLTEKNKISSVQIADTKVSSPKFNIAQSISPLGDCLTEHDVPSHISAESVYKTNSCSLKKSSTNKKPKKSILTLPNKEIDHQQDPICPNLPNVDSPKCTKPRKSLVNPVTKSRNRHNAFFKASNDLKKETHESIHEIWSILRDIKKREFIEQSVFSSSSVETLKRRSATNISNLPKYMHQRAMKTERNYKPTQATIQNKSKSSYKNEVDSAINRVNQTSEIARQNVQQWVDSTKAPKDHFHPDQQNMSEKPAIESNKPNNYGNNGIRDIEINKRQVIDLSDPDESSSKIALPLENLKKKFINSKNTADFSDNNKLKKKLASIKYPLVILGPEQLSSTYRYYNYDPPQFNGLDERIWPFMIDWYTDTNQLKNKLIKDRRTSNITLKRFDNETTSGALVGRVIGPDTKDFRKISKVICDRKEKSPSKDIPRRNKLFAASNRDLAPQISSKLSKVSIKKTKHTRKKVNTGKLETEIDKKIKTSAIKYKNDKSGKMVAATSQDKITKYNRARAKWACNFIENIILNLNQGVYFRENKDVELTKIHKLILPESQNTISFQREIDDEKHEFEHKDIDFMYNEADYDSKPITGFDEILPKLEFKFLSQNKITIRNLNANIELMFDVIPLKEDSGSAESLSCIPVNRVESPTRIYKCNKKILHNALPSELCSMVPKILNNEIKVKKVHDTFGHEPTKFLFLAEILKTIHVKLPWTLRILSGTFKLHSKPVFQYKLHGNRADLDIISDVYLDILLYLPKSLLAIDINPPKFYTSSVKWLRQKCYTTVYTPREFTWCTKIVPYMYCENFLTRILQKEGIRIIVNLLAKDNKRVKIYVDISILKLIQDNGEMQFNNLFNDHSLSKYLNLLRIGTRNVLSAKERNDDLDRISFNFNDITETPTFLNINAIRCIKDALKYIGIHGNLCSVFEEPDERKLLGYLKKITAWISEVTPKQLLLYLILSTKKDKKKFDPDHGLKYRLLQRIALNRITTVSQLNTELDEADNEISKEVPHPKENNKCTQSCDDGFMQELLSIAKYAAQENKLPFDEGTSRKSLIAMMLKRKMSQSYLRVMARYVGLNMVNKK